MNAATLAAHARRMDSSIDPWSFSATNPGYQWLLAQAGAALTADLAKDPDVQTKSVTAGSVSSQKTFFGRSTTKSDVIEDAIAIYEAGLTTLPTVTRGVFA